MAAFETTQTNSSLKIKQNNLLYENERNCENPFKNLENHFIYFDIHPFHRLWLEFFGGNKQKMRKRPLNRILLSEKLAKIHFFFIYGDIHLGRHRNFPYKQPLIRLYNVTHPSRSLNNHLCSRRNSSLSIKLKQKIQRIQLNNGRSKHNNEQFKSILRTSTLNHPVYNKQQLQYKTQ